MSKSTSRHQKVSKKFVIMAKVHQEFKNMSYQKFVVTSKICHDVQKVVFCHDVKKIVIMSKTHNDVKVTSWRQNVFHHNVKKYVKKFVMTLKGLSEIHHYRDYVKNMSWCQKVCHDVKTVFFFLSYDIKTICHNVKNIQHDVKVTSGRQS